MCSALGLCSALGDIISAIGIVQCIWGGIISALGEEISVFL